MANQAQAKKGKLGPKRIVSAIGHFFRDLKSEIKKIVWPTKKQTINNTIVVLAVMLFVGVIVWLLDLGLGALVDLVLKNGAK